MTPNHLCFGEQTLPWCGQEYVQTNLHEIQFDQVANAPLRQFGGHDSQLIPNIPETDPSSWFELGQ